MKRSLELAVASARARAVPWDTERAERVGRRLASERGRSWVTAGVTRFALAGLGSAALFASSLRLSSALRDGEPPAHQLEVSALAPADSETDLVEPRWGDAGQDASPSAQFR
jgi:hypothetical protein